MNKISNLLVILTISLISTAPKANNQAPLMSRVVSSCIVKYRLETNKTESAHIDRAYIVTFNGLANVLFTKGAMGTFTKRSKNYQSYFYCGVKLLPNISVVYLQSSHFEVIYQDKSFELSQLEFNYNKGIEYLFKKKDGEYIFYAEQPFDEQKLNVIK